MEKLSVDSLRIIYKYKRDMEILEKMERIIKKNKDLYQKCYNILVQNMVMRNHFYLENFDNFLEYMRQNTVLQVFYWSLFRLRNLESRRFRVWKIAIPKPQIYFFTVPEGNSNFNVRKLLKNMGKSKNLTGNTVDQILNLIRSHVLVQNP